MATKDGNRVNKDTSARKNITAPVMRSALEVIAIKASHEAYVNSIVAGYETQIQTLEAAHAAEVAMLRAERSNEMKLASEKEQAKVDKVIAKTQQDNVDQIAQLRTQNAELVTRVKHIQKLLDDTRVKNESDASNAKGLAARLRGRITTLQGTHEHEIQEMQSKIAVDIVFHCSRFHERRFTLRSTKPFEEAATQLAKSIKTWSVSQIAFRHNGKRITDLSTTIREV